jgi:hypothetical protein
MFFAKSDFLLALLASSVFGCQRVEAVMPIDGLTKKPVSTSFNGSKAGDQREVAGIKLCWCDGQLRIGV